MKKLTRNKMKCRRPVSLCLLTHNRDEKLGRAIETVLGQTYENFELIINDDASTDRTEEICREYEHRDSRVHYECNDENLMLAGNANRALQRANHNLVGILHDSDLYEPFMVERWVEKMVDYPSAAIVFHGHYRKTNGEPNIHRYSDFIKGKNLLKDMLKRWDSPIYGICMMRKRMVCEAGGYNEKYPFLSDVDLYMKLLDRYNAAYVGEPLVKYAPREEDHEYRGAHWGEEKSIYKIRRKNIVENFEKGSYVRKDLLESFNRDLKKRFALKLMWCIKNMRWDLVKEGFELYKKFES